MKVETRLCKVGFHYPSSRPEFTARELRCIFWHPSTLVVETGRPCTRVHGPWTRVVETDLNAGCWYWLLCVCDSVVEPAGRGRVWRASRINRADWCSANSLSHPGTSWWVAAAVLVMLFVRSTFRWFMFTADATQSNASINQCPHVSVKPNSDTWYISVLELQLIDECCSYWLKTWSAINWLKSIDCDVTVCPFCARHWTTYDCRTR